MDTKFNVFEVLQIAEAEIDETVERQEGEHERDCNTDRALGGEF